MMSVTDGMEWRTWGGVLCGLALALIGGNAAATDAPPDLHLEWIVGGKAVTEAPPISGKSGATMRLRYRVRNVGGLDAFAVVATAHTALGRTAPPRRIEPGPKAGQSIERTLSVALAHGMRELCLEVRLQNLGADDPEDPEPSNNRRCRTVDVDRSGNEREPRRQPSTPREVSQ